jgi:putative ABC transport system permease protein
MSDKFRIIIQSIKFYKKPVLYQILIIVLLCAVITGSLLTGSSVKESLKKSSTERLGNTGIVISSGNRYFDSDLVQRMKGRSGVGCTGILEINGYCQSLSSQKGAFNTHIYCVNKNFFIFHGHDSMAIRPGEIAVNKQLADYLGIKAGDDLIIRFKEINDIPSDAPFAPAQGAGKSIVMKVGSILEPNQTGNFSLSISQITPMNIFINLPDIEDDKNGHLKLNRLLIKRDNRSSLKVISEALKYCLKPSDTGLRLRLVKKTGEYELVSDRVFIDELILKEIGNIIPASFPVLTYLGNRFVAGTRSTPYSFVSALPSSLYPDIVAGNGMIINKWMAQDLSVRKGDTIHMFWYSPDSLNKLIEKNSDFIIKRIVDMQGIWSDSLLMPDFPGISGKESCSEWDAGVPIKMHEIRTKDEDYWNRYRGTPKAFISYEKGRELWGNNFGPATGIRYPAGITEKLINDKLEGSFDPQMMGFIISDLSVDSDKAANESVDFGTLFLSLSFFLILASLVLLSFAISSYFDTKRKHINTLYALGFKNKWISQLLFLETGLTGLVGCLIGVFAGYLVNILITRALNTVWNGAVQTNTLNAYFDLMPVISGFLMTFLTILVLILIKIKYYLNSLNKMDKVIYHNPSIFKNLFLMIASAIVTISLFVLSVYLSDHKVEFSFATGAVLLLTLVLLWQAVLYQQIC